MVWPGLAPRQPNCRALHLALRHWNVPGTQDCTQHAKRNMQTAIRLAVISSTPLPRCCMHHTSHWHSMSDMCDTGPVVSHGLLSPVKVCRSNKGWIILSYDPCLFCINDLMSHHVVIHGDRSTSVGTRALKTCT